MTTQRQMAAIFVAAVAVRLGFHIYTGFTADDALITFRYADNLASGLGFVYNEGQRVMGTTSPLFTFLIAIGRLVSFPAVSAALLISLLANGCTAVLLFRLAQSLRFTHLAALPSLVYILWPRSLAAETCGMETALFTCLTVAAIYYHHRQATVYSLAAATLAVLTRPEGAWLLLLLTIDTVVRHRGAILAYLAVPISLIVPWLAFAWYYFGSVIPHSITAKMVLYDYIKVDGPLERFWYVMGFHSPVGWLLMALAIAGAYWLNRKQNYGWLAIAWVTGLILFYTVSGTHLFFWYLAPIYPMYLLLASAAAPLVVAVARVSPQLYRVASPWIQGVAALLLLIGSVSPAHYYKSYQKYLDETHKAIGAYLLQHANSSALLAAEDIGYIGYFSRLRLLDRDGLVSPETLPYLKSESPMQLLFDYHPDWIVTNAESPYNQFTDSVIFLDKYALERRFGGAGGDAYELWRVTAK